MLALKKWARSVVFSGCLGSGCIVSSSAPAADWLQFRGTQGDGESRITDLPAQWSQTEHVAWRRELPGEGWSSPVVFNERIYLTAAISAQPDKTDSDRQLVLMIVDAKSGQLLNRVDLFTESGAKAPRIHAKNSHASPTPLISGDRVYLHFGHQGTACCNLAGEVLWRNDQLTYAPVHGNGGSPVLVDNSLIFTQDGAEKGKVIALDARTGQVRWEVERGVEAKKMFSFCTPLVLDVAGKTQVIVPGSNVVQSLDAATGNEIWRVRYEGYSVIPKPVVAAGLVMVCTGYDRPSLLAIKPDGQGDVTETHVVWKTDAAVAHTPSLSVRGDWLFMVSDKGIATCWDAKSGQELWKERIGGNFSASPLLAGDRLYLLSEEGDTTVIAAEPKFKEIAKNKLGERTLASMAVVDQDLLIRSSQALYRITR